MIAGILYEHIKSYTYKRERVLRMSKFKEYEKFMHLKKLIIPTITVLVLTSQLCGCATASSKEAMNMIRNNESIEITVAEPASSTSKQGTETYIQWTELAYLTTYPDLRADMDDLLYIIPMQDGKNGCIYVDSEGNHNNNTTLKDAFNNKKFVQDFWNNTEVSQAIITSSKQTFSDVETDQEALLAAYNAYYNLLPDGADPSSANMQSTLTRLEAMALVYKADTPVNHDLQPSSEYLNLLGASASASEASDSSKADLVLFAEQIDKSGNSYLTLSNNSLDQSTATGTMTRAEFIYLLVQRYFSSDYNTLTDESIKASSKVIAYTDLTNAGNVAKKQKYITTEKNPDTGIKEEVALNRYQAYELNYCLQNADKGLTEPLYKAYIIASQKGILPDEEETNWDIGLTKEYALDVLFNTLESIGSKVRYDRGEAHGEIVEADSASGSSTASTENNADATTNGQLETPSEQLTEEEGAYYIKVNADGTREYSPYLITDLMGDSRFAGLTYDEVIFILDMCLNPAKDSDDAKIRESLSKITDDIITMLVVKDEPQSSSTTSNQGQQQSSTSQGQSSNSNQSTNQGQSSNQNTTQGQTSQQQQTNPQPMQEPTLTQEELDELYGEGGRLSHFNDAPVLGDSGESWDGRKYN